MRRPAARVLVLLAACAGSAPRLHAQARPFGELAEARPIDLRERCRPPQPASAVVDTIEVRRGPAWTSARLPMIVLANDGVAVHRLADARLRAGPGDASDGLLFLVPSLLCHPGIDADTVIRGLSVRQGTRAEYELFTTGGGTRRAGGRERPGVAIERGALIVQWSPRVAGTPLLVLALGDTFTVTGTRLAVAVDSAQRTGLAYLETGHARLNALQGRAMAEGEILYLRRGFLPVRVGREAEEALRASVKYHAEDLWKGVWPPPARPHFRLLRVGLIGVGVAGAGYATYRLWPRAAGDRTGEVVLTLPH